MTNDDETKTELEWVTAGGAVAEVTEEGMLEAMAGDRGTFANVALRPWSFSRNTLWRRLRAVYAVEGGGFEQDAAVILWLATHEPMDWEPMEFDLPALRRTVMRWADAHLCPGDVEPVERALKIVTDALKTEAMPEPTTRGGGDSGNEPGL